MHDDGMSSRLGSGDFSPTLSRPDIAIFTYEVSTSTNTCPLDVDLLATYSLLFTFLLSHSDSDILFFKEKKY